jgi:uncharacterized RDD family membrane protein YckC
LSKLLLDPETPGKKENVMMATTPPTEPNGPPSVPPATALPPPATKADLSKRFIAGLIDAIPAIVVSAVFGLIPFIGGIIGGLAAAGWWLVRDGLDLEFADRRSPGKKLMKLRPLQLNGQPVTMELSIKRNLPLAIYAIGFVLWVVPVLGHLLSIPIFLVGGIIGVIEIVLVLTDPEGRRMGDKLANTRVVDTGE